jgi:hypothetical protein
MENNQQVLEVLAGRAYKTVDKTATLNVEMYLDDSASAGIISALWDAASAHLTPRWHFSLMLMVTHLLAMYFQYFQQSAALLLMY